MSLDSNGLCDASWWSKELKSECVAICVLQRKGVKEGDFLVKVASKDVKWCKHDEVVALMRTEGSHLVLQVVTPVDHNFITNSQGATASPQTPKTPSVTRMRKDSTVSYGTLKKDRQRSSTKSSKSGSWNFRKRSKSREKKSKYMVHSNGSGPDVIAR